MSPAARRGLVFLAIAAGLLVGVLASEIWRRSGDGSSSLAQALSPSPTIGGPFALVDQNGRTRTSAEFRGKLMLVYFGYTYCPDVCPTELQTMSAALDLLGEGAREVVPIFITVDPERDTPEQLKLYAESFHPSLVALTGAPDRIGEAARAYKVYVSKGKATGDDYLVDHSSYLFLMGRDGRYAQHFLPNATPEAIVAAIKAKL